MELNHIDENGQAKMVNVGNKPISRRKAVAAGKIVMSPDTVNAIKDGKIIKGNVLNTAVVAGIAAGKKTSELIPMCHNIVLDSLDVDITLGIDCVTVTATALAESKTGVEMEALTAAGVSLLTIYDMVKAIDKYMEIDKIRLIYKEGGKSGIFRREYE